MKKYSIELVGGLGVVLLLGAPLSIVWGADFRWAFTLALFAGPMLGYAVVYGENK